MDVTEAMEACPRRLPVVGHAGRQWFVDLRLREFRTTGIPWVLVGFNSPEGVAMCEKFGIERCPFCPAYIMVGDGAEQGNAICRNCGATVVFNPDDNDAPGHAGPSSSILRRTRFVLRFPGAVRFAWGEPPRRVGLSEVKT